MQHRWRETQRAIRIVLASVLASLELISEAPNRLTALGRIAVVRQVAAPISASNTA